VRRVSQLSGPNNGKVYGSTPTGRSRDIVLTTELRGLNHRTIVRPETSGRIYDVLGAALPFLADANG